MPTSTARSRTWLAASTAIGALLLAAPAAADLTVTVKDDGVEQKIYLTPDKLAMQSPEGFFAFDAKAETMRMRDPKGNEHTMTKKDIESLAGMSKQASQQTPEMNEMMAQARKEAEEALAELPAEQQAEARKVLEMSLPSDAKPVTASSAKSYEPMNKTQEINGHKCKGYAIKSGDKVIGETWVTGLADLGIEASDLAIMTKLHAFLGAAFADTPAAESLSDLERLDPKSDRFIGVPVRTVENGAVTELVGIDKGKIDAKVFQASVD